MGNYAINSLYWVALAITNPFVKIGVISKHQLTSVPNANISAKLGMVKDSFIEVRSAAHVTHHPGPMITTRAACLEGDVMPWQHQH